jgi:pimeloyl-ACP methyl ester carboxylesterase
MDVEYSSGTIISIPSGHHKIDALFYHIVTHKEHLNNKPVILRLHGILGNLLDETEHFLPTVLAKHGYSSMTTNTLLANLGLFFGFGIFDDAMAQIDAVCHFLRDVGFRKIVVAGHGLGGCMAIRYGALRNESTLYPDIVGVIAMATPHSMPETIRTRWDRFGSEPSYEEVYSRAQRVFRTGSEGDTPRDETIVVKKAHGQTSLPEHTDIYTLKTWWALAGPEAEGAKAFKHIGHIKVPILLVHGLNDDIVQYRECEVLDQLARDGGNNDVMSCHLDADHTFEGKHDELGHVIIRWLTERFGHAQDT